MGKRKHPGGFGGRGSRQGNDRETDRRPNDRRSDERRSDKPKYGDARAAEKRPEGRFGPQSRERGPEQRGARPAKDRFAAVKNDRPPGGRGDSGRPAGRPESHAKGPRDARFSRRDAPNRPAFGERRARPEPTQVVPAVRPPAAKTEASGSWLYGHHAILAALANPRRICHRLLVTEETQTALNPELADAVRARSPKLPVRVVERRDIEAILPHAVHQGIALDCLPLSEADLLDTIAALPERALLMVLDQVTDPHNVGAILRSAAAFGVAAVIVTERHAPHETGALAKAAAGALETVPVVRVINLARAMHDLKDANIWCLGLDGAATQNVEQADSSGRIALVLGAEGSGLRRLTRETCDLLIKIPMAGAAQHKGLDSLNVSNAAAVALYALSRKAS